MARFLCDGQEGRRASERPIRRPSSALPFDREDPTGAEERRRSGCAYSHLVSSGKFVTRVNILRAVGLGLSSDLPDETCPLTVMHQRDLNSLLSSPVHKFLQDQYMDFLYQ